MAFLWLPKSHLIALATGLVAIGGFSAYVIRQNYQITLDRWRSELSASVRYQNWILQNSFGQSQDDARMLAASVTAGNSLRANSQRQLNNLFEEYRSIYEYDAIYLLNTSGQVIIQAADVSPEQMLGDRFREVFQAVVSTGRPAVELDPRVKKEVTLLFLTPVFARGTTNRTGPLIGAIAIVGSFARDLLPLLTAKRVSARTNEMVLLQPQGKDWRYLGARAVGVEPSDTLRRVAPSAAENRELFGQFVDYRGHEVLASIERVPGIQSVLASKVDSDEAFAEFRRVVRIETVAAVAILLAYIGLIVIHTRSVAARQMREGLERQQFVNQILEATVAERTGELARANNQLQQELGERQRAEEEVRRFNVELDQRVNDRTRELEEANKDLQAFSYSVSHDLRAPLRRVRGFSTILLEEHAPELSGEVQELLQVVNRNTIQMGELIDCLLAFSQLGRKPLRKQRVIPAVIVAQAWQELSVDRDGRSVELNLGRLPACDADPLLLKQVFVNLLSNALKYSRTRETSKIDIGFSDGGAFFVRDNGVGFDMRYRDKLFGVFKRLHRAEDYEGIGIGLATVQRIVNRHGGEIWADSVLGECASFYFTLA